jgi:hypothetical protein
MVCADLMHGGASAWNLLIFEIKLKYGLTTISKFAPLNLVVSTIFADLIE